MPAKRPIVRPPPVLTLCLSVAMIVGVVLVDLYPLMREYEASLYLLLITSPISLLLIYMAGEGFRRYTQNARPGFGLYLMVGFAILIFVSGLLHAADRMFDHSGVRLETHLVISKRTWMYRGARRYVAQIKSPVSSPLPFHFRDIEEIPVPDQAEYDQIVPDQTEIVLKIHAGFLRMPWCEPYMTTHKNVTKSVSRSSLKDFSR